MIAAVHVRPCGVLASRRAISTQGVKVAVLRGPLTIGGILWGVYGLIGSTLGIYVEITGYPHHGLPAFGPDLSGIVIFAMGAAAASDGQRLRTGRRA